MYFQWNRRPGDSLLAPRQDMSPSGAGSHLCHAVGWGALAPDVFLMIIMASSQQTESKGSMSTETSWRKNKGNSKKSANETQITDPTPRSPREVPKQLGYGLATLATALVPNLGRGRCEHRIFLLVPSIPQWPNEIVLGSACCSLDKYGNTHRQG